MAHRLIVFTSTFPFGDRESFLEQEVPYLSACFDEVVFIPLGGAATKQRILPQGAVADDRLHCSRHKKILKGILNCWRVFPSYYIDFFRSGVFLNKNKFKKWIKTTLLASFYLQSKPIRELNKSIKQDDVLYYYWGIDYNCISPFFKGKCVQVSRFHGDWDLWRDGGKSEPYCPCRKNIISSLSCAVTISNKGKVFLESIYPDLNVKTFRLGSLDCGVSKKSEDGIIRMLSCSTVYPLKRVDYIFECLETLAFGETIIDWTHIGGGPGFDELNKKCLASNNKNITINLIGNLTHDEVLSYYKNHCVDLFINLSTNEGIPVSIMEAISFNVPVVATDVGATGEIVTEDTGCLVSCDPSVNEVTNAIKDVLQKNLNPRAFWEQSFTAHKNYNQFANYLKSLSI